MRRGRSASCLSTAIQFDLSRRHFLFEIYLKVARKSLVLLEPLIQRVRFLDENCGHVARYAIFDLMPPACAFVNDVGKLQPSLRNERSERSGLHQYQWLQR